MAEEVERFGGTAVERSTAVFLGLGAVAICSVTVLSESAFALLLAVTFPTQIGLILFGLSQRPPEEGTEGVGWWYRATGFPWLALIGLGLLAYPAGVSAIFWGGLFRLPAVIVAIAPLLFVARWAFYRRRIARPLPFRRAPLRSMAKSEPSEGCIGRRRPGLESNPMISPG